MLLLAELERHAIAERQVVASLRATGHDLTFPAFTELREQFDHDLAAEPEPESESAKLLRELGVS